MASLSLILTCLTDLTVLTCLTALTRTGGKGVRVDVGRRGGRGAIRDHGLENRRGSRPYRNHPNATSAGRSRQFQSHRPDYLGCHCVAIAAIGETTEEGHVTWFLGAPTPVAEPCPTGTNATAMPATADGAIQPAPLLPSAAMERRGESFGC